MKHEEECFITYPNTAEKFVENTRRNLVFFNLLKKTFLNTKCYSDKFELHMG